MVYDTAEWSKVPSSYVHMNIACKKLSVYFSEFFLFSSVIVVCFA